MTGESNADSERKRSYAEAIIYEWNIALEQRNDVAADAVMTADKMRDRMQPFKI